MLHFIFLSLYHFIADLSVLDKNLHISPQLLHLHNNSAVILHYALQNPAIEQFIDLEKYET